MKQANKRTTVLAGVAAGGIAAVAAVALAVSPAQAEDPAPSASAAPAPSASAAAPAQPGAPARPDREAARAQRQDELAAALATELGIDKARVAAALEKVQAAQRTEAQADRLTELKTRLDAAVAAGRLTADEAAAALKAAEAGVLPPGGGHGHGRGPGR